ncbi:hypothetical protein M501DRAFT_764332 [Patellaria atrata CBS 101060]|uniref:Secreted protein n=1 Tax=Patellaria atrata CBS 101060 TaxID=1346257 RepID=A0A9P4VT21_9PEZI|nr:hypothetical protein M501DRAFT_764332 [Patellaria atrata CBS 101060]
MLARVMFPATLASLVQCWMLGLCGKVYYSNKYFTLDFISILGLRSIILVQQVFVQILPSPHNYLGPTSTSYMIFLTHYLLH